MYRIFLFSPVELLAIVQSLTQARMYSNSPEFIQVADSVIKKIHEASNIRIENKGLPGDGCAWNDSLNKFFGQGEIDK